MKIGFSGTYAESKSASLNFFLENKFQNYILQTSLWYVKKKKYIFLLFNEFVSWLFFKWFNMENI